MTKSKIYLLGALLIPLAVAVIVSCTKSFDEKTAQQKSFNNSSLIQVYMAMGNVARNYVWVDGNLITGSLMSSGSLFPSTAYAASIEPGVKSFLVRDTLSTSAQVPINFAENMQVGKQYTIFIYDTLSAPKQKTVETNIVIPADTTARIRFANFAHTKTAVPGVDVFSKRLNRNIFTNVNISEVTDFIPFPSSFTDTLSVRSTGTLTDLVVLNTVSLGRKRSATLVLRGSYYVTSGVHARALSVFTNY